MIKYSSPRLSQIHSPEMSSTPAVQIDHIVILLPYPQLVSPPSWLTTNFTISPGGVHSDGCTENKLILFQDGTYIELIAFINDDPARKEGHRWGKKQFGLIDFALTTPPNSKGGDTAAAQYSAVAQRLSATTPAAALGIRYLEPIAGGRKNPGGTELQWKVTFPTHETQVPQGTYASSVTGAVPFLCHDVTPRTLRVDINNVQATTHPSAVKGIAQFSVIVPPEKLESYIDLYSLILDTKPLQLFGTARFQLTAPIRIPGLVKPWVFIEAPDLDPEKARLAKRGVEVVELALRVGAPGGGVGMVRDSVRVEGIWIHFLK